jgi:recombinational DNA repair protein (RecF pathway)
MRVDIANAYFLIQRPYQDDSAYISFFTRERGILTGFYKKPSMHPPVLKCFHHYWISVYQKPNTCSIQGIESNDNTTLFPQDILICGYYVNELLLYMLPQGDAHFSVFDAYDALISQLHSVVTSHVIPSASVAQREGSPAYGATSAGDPSLQAPRDDMPGGGDRISNKEDLERLLRHFEWNVMEACGYGVAVDDIQPNRYYVWDPELGLQLATVGYLGANILAIAEGDFSSTEVLVSAKAWIRHRISHLLQGKKLRSLELYRSLMYGK